MSVAACGTSRRTCQRYRETPVGVVPGDVRGATRDRRSGCLHHDVLMVQEQLFLGTRQQLVFTFDVSLLLSPSTTLVDTAGDPQFLPGCTGVSGEQPTRTSSSWQSRWIFFRAGYFDGFRPLDCMGSTPLSGHWPSGNTIFLMWGRYLPNSDEKVPRVLHYMKQLDLMPFREMDVVEAVLDRSILQDDHRALWCSIVPLIYFGTIEWHQLFEVALSDNPGSSADFLWWWYLAARRYLVPAGPYHHLPADEIPVEATQKQLASHPERPTVPDVPDNRRSGRRMMVGTRPTARDWQWLDDMIGEDASAERSTQKIRRMPESYGRRRGGRGGRGRGEGGDTTPTLQTQGAWCQHQSGGRGRGDEHTG
ncbi:hypothetical protein PIB30_022828 [Stylosanthes scabra]|uniref:Aminotransferase-like plant mobile domain-containing protein n=1 Tax=Stylosanthes scabra TaxID=79078 RepID=A0ABU6VAV6_9FABA|nr:hypothetical protein [Stylosanthes scabra]